jgi:hypothetical protein
MIIEKQTEGNAVMTSPTVLWMATAPVSKTMTRTEKMGVPAGRRGLMLKPVMTWAVAFLIGIAVLLQTSPHA